MCYNCLVIYLLLPNTLLHHPLPYTPLRTASASSHQFLPSNIQYLMSNIQYSIRGTNAPIPLKNLSWGPFLLRALTNFVGSKYSFLFVFFRGTNTPVRAGRPFTDMHDKKSSTNSNFLLTPHQDDTFSANSQLLTANSFYLKSNC